MIIKELNNETLTAIWHNGGVRINPDR